MMNIIIKKKLLIGVGAGVAAIGTSALLLIKAVGNIASGIVGLAF